MPTPAVPDWNLTMAQGASAGPLAPDASDKPSRVYVGTKGTTKVSPQQLRAEGLTSKAKWNKAGFADKEVAGTQANKSAAYKTTDEMYAQWNEWSPAEQKAFADKMVNLGLMTPESAADYDQVRKAWMSMVDEAANYASAGKQLTVDDVVHQYAAFANTAGGLAAKQAKFTGTKSTSDTTLDITDPTSAKAAINQIFQTQYGRDAAPGEIQQFTAALNTAERQNPVVSKTDTQVVNDEAVAQTVTKTGGVDGNQVITDQARAKPEYGAYQAATTYANALFGALASPI